MTQRKKAKPRTRARAKPDRKQKPEFSAAESEKIIAWLSDLIGSEAAHRVMGTEKRAPIGRNESGHSGNDRSHFTS